VARIVSDDIRISRVEALLDGPGYVLPSDVRDQLVRSDTLWTISTATIDYAGFKPAVNPTPAELDRFFQQNTFRYELPPTVEVSYVDFPAQSFVSQVSVTEPEVRAYYDANPARFPAAQPAKGKKADPAAAYASVRPLAEAALKLERARNLAIRAASDLAYALYDDKVSAGAALESYLASRKLSLRPVAPFSRDAAPAALGGSADVADAAFKLSAERYFSEALPTPNGGIVLIYKGSHPARTPLLVEVRAKVEADYAENQRRERFVALGRTLHDAILAKVRSGIPFERAATAAAAAAGVRIEARSLPPFTLASRPKDLNDTVGGTLAHLDKGQLSDMAVTPDKGYLVYVQDRRTPDASAAGPRFADVRAQLAMNSARGASGAYLEQIVQAELKRSEAALK
jgi:peptidyl-prolyl cis-trans isomerase D